MHRAATILSILLTAGFAAAAPARAEGEGPVIVIPSRPGIPVVINGVDASYAVVEGDWGLARPGAVPVTVIGGAPLLPNEVYSRRRSYHPRYGWVPPRGRYEVEPSPDHPLPEPAESFSRSWSTSSDVRPVSEPPRRALSINPPGMVPPTITDPQTYPEDFNPAVAVEPRRRSRRH